MAHLIDKVALVAKIERLKQEARELYGCSQFDTAYKNVLKSINTLEVKEETEWKDASRVRPPFNLTFDSNKYSNPVLCKDKCGCYHVAQYVRWRTGWCGWVEGNNDNEVNITHWKELP